MLPEAGNVGLLSADSFFDRGVQRGQRDADGNDGN